MSNTLTGVSANSDHAVFVPMTSIVGGSYSNSGITIQSGSGLATTYGFSSSTNKNDAKRIGPKLYFNYVKSKLTKLEQKKLKSRLSKLQTLVKNAEDMGQHALYEEFGKMLAVVARETEAAVCGYDTWVNTTDITKFMTQVRENDESKQQIVFFKKLEEFSRVIPADIQKVIKSAKKKGIFDELWVLYLDYSGEQVKTNKEKIREKDPILFGRFSYDPNKMFYLADWVDEYCDLTLSKFVDTLKASDPEYQVNEVEEIDADLVERIKKEVKERHERLANTNRENFRELMTREQEDRLAREQSKTVPAPTKRWFEFWK